MRRVPGVEVFYQLQGRRTCQLLAVVGASSTVDDKASVRNFYLKTNDMAMRPCRNPATYLMMPSHRSVDCCHRFPAGFAALGHEAAVELAWVIGLGDEFPCRFVVRVIGTTSALGRFDNTTPDLSAVDTDFRRGGNT